MIHVKIFYNDEYINCINIYEYDKYDSLHKILWANEFMAKIIPPNLRDVRYSLMSLYFFPIYLHPDEQIINIPLLETSPLLINFILFE